MASTAMMEIPAKDVFSVDEAARVCGLGRSTLFNMAWRGEIASLKVGRRRLIRREALMRWLEQQEELEMAGRRSA